uniref:F-box domain-containing protein n=1 Tax=Panagrolaimus davidi TaxID=227884 RepID=A0A914QC36_9BILA
MNSTKFENFLPQEFSLPKPLIRCILENASSYLLKKLNKTCKYLFIKRNITIIDKLFIFDDVVTYGYKECISGYNVKIHLSNLNLFKDNLWITDKLTAYYSAPNLSSIVNKIVKCDIKILNVFENDVTFNEFKILTASGNIQQIALFSQIQYSDGTNLAFDDLLLMVPKASNIE